MATHILGYPRIGTRRELKRALEAFWKGESSEAALLAAAKELRARHWKTQAEAGVTLLPSNDFSLYDHVLDVSCLVGNVPVRFGWSGEGDVGLDVYFAMARGLSREKADCGCGGHGAQGEGGESTACEMTKWFDTNYHFLVPEFNEATAFRLASRKPWAEFEEALALGHRTKPVLLGPVSYLFLGKERDTKPGFDRWKLLPRLLEVYAEVLRGLASRGAEWVQLDEPIFALDLEPKHKQFLAEAYAALSAAAPDLKLLVASYFGAAGQNLLALKSLPVAGIHLDVTRGAEDLEDDLKAGTKDKIISLGIIDGRNIWRARFAETLPLVRKAVDLLGRERVWLAPSCSLLHVPVRLQGETHLASEIKGWLAFAEEKLGELQTLASLAVADAPEKEEAYRANVRLHARRLASPLLNRAEMRRRLAVLSPEAQRRHAPFPARQAAQRAALKLPAFPTTTIGSFPQTAEVRSWRARWRKGDLSTEVYETLLEQEIVRCLKIQEDISLDVLVHGEFERTDMVEYFGEQLEGFAFTQNGWVQSYGSRCVKPPLIFGDVERPRPMTVRWFRHAQQHTRRPMKGMLTGPVTILNWSFVRDDVPRWEVCRQIGLAIRDEVADLEAAGCRIIQIDEAALREGLPLRKKDRDFYLRWAVEAFRLASTGVRDETQIHTHMCYSDFNDIIEAIAAMDADVITIETSRSAMELLEAFAHFRYPNEIGPGVYDIHSPRVPTEQEMRALMDRAIQVLPPENLWVNPDCGLKTRAWPEVQAALHVMVAVAKDLRAEAEATAAKAVPAAALA